MEGSQVTILCSVCGRPPHTIDDPECMPATKPIAEKLAWALAEIERLRIASNRQIAQLTRELENVKAHADQWRDDGGRLDWLDAQSNEALLEFGFEIDGGVYLCIESPGAVPVDIRAMNSARAAIDFAMTIRPAECSPPSPPSKGTAP